MKKILLAFIIVSVFNITLSFADNPIWAEVDKTKITTDEVVTYKIVIDSLSKDTLKPHLPEFEGLYVVSSSQSSNITFSREGAKTVLGFTFILAPKETGKFTIGPASVEVKGEVYSTDSFEIEVTQGKRQLPDGYQSQPSRRHPKLRKSRKQPEIIL